MMRHRIATLAICAAYAVARWAYMNRQEWTDETSHEFADVNELRAIRDRYMRNV